MPGHLFEEYFSERAKAALALAAEAADPEVRDMYLKMAARLEAEQRKADEASWAPSPSGNAMPDVPQ
jgi:hypothetical protein